MERSPFTYIRTNTEQALSWADNPYKEPCHAEMSSVVLYKISLLHRVILPKDQTPHLDALPRRAYVELGLKSRMRRPACPAIFLRVEALDHQRLLRRHPRRIVPSVAGVVGEIESLEALASRNRAPVALGRQQGEDLAEIGLGAGAGVADGEGVAQDGTPDRSPHVDNGPSRFREAGGVRGREVLVKDLLGSVV